MKRCTQITRFLAPLCFAFATQAQAQGVPVAGPAAVYEIQAQVKAIADCVESDRGSLSLCLCLVGIDDSQSGTQRLSEIMRCLDEQEAVQ